VRLGATHLAAPGFAPEPLPLCAQFPRLLWLGANSYLPVPARLTVCGLFKALSTNVRVPAAAPLTVGENFTLTLHFAPAAMLAPQVLLEIAKPALVAMLEKLSATVILFVTVTDLAELLLPTVTVPKLRLLADSVTGVLPVPERLTV